MTVFLIGSYYNIIIVIVNVGCIPPLNYSRTGRLIAAYPQLLTKDMKTHEKRQRQLHHEGDEVSEANTLELFSEDGIGFFHYFFDFRFVLVGLQECFGEFFDFLDNAAQPGGLGSSGILLLLERDRFQIFIGNHH